MRAGDDQQSNTIEGLHMDILVKIVSFIGRERQAKALSMASKGMYSLIGNHVLTRHVPACRIQKFWRWCKLFSMSKSLMKGFQRTRLDSVAFLREME